MLSCFDPFWFFLVRFDFILDADSSMELSTGCLQPSLKFSTSQLDLIWKHGELLLVIITWSHSLSTSWADWLPCVLEQLRPSCLPLASQSVRESSVVAWSARDQWRCWTKPIHNHHPRILIPRFLFKWFYKMKKIQ